MEALEGRSVCRNEVRFARTVDQNTPATILPGVCVEPSDDLARGIVAALPDDGKEHLFVVALDTHGVPLAWDIVASGTVDSCPLYARDVYAWALTIPCTRMVGIAHNHPSGDTSPSPADVSGTKSLAAAGRLIGLDLVWSLVVTHRNGTWSAIPFDRTGTSGRGGDDETGTRPPEPDEPAETEPEPTDEPGDEPTDEPADVPETDGADPDDLAAAIEKLISGTIRR